jgi:glutathione S-transferase
MQKKLDDFFEELNCWEKFLSEQQASGDAFDFLASRQLSMADIVFFPNLVFCVRMGLDLHTGKHPSLLRYYNKMAELPTVQKTWPPHWRETLPSKKIFVECGQYVRNIWTEAY